MEIIVSFENTIIIMAFPKNYFLQINFEISYIFAISIISVLLK